MSLLSVEDVHTYYGQSHVLQGVSLDLDAGEVVALEKDTGDLRWFVETRGQATSAPVPHDGRVFAVERAVMAGCWDDDAEDQAQVPGHAYCLVEAE